MSLCVFSRHATDETTVNCKKIITFIGIQHLGRFGQRPEISQVIDMALVHCILGKFAITFLRV